MWAFRCFTGKGRLKVNQDERKDFVHDGSDPGVCRYGADRRGRGAVDAVRRNRPEVVSHGRRSYPN